MIKAALLAIEEAEVEICPLIYKIKKKSRPEMVD